jgi:hypothetical protein
MPQKKYDVKRNKERFSFVIENIFTYDFTIVNNKKFEMEIELLPNLKDISSEDFIQILITHLERILRKKQKSYYLLTPLKTKNIIEEIFSLTKKEYFLAQAETLNVYQIDKIKTNYAMTPKIDGERYFTYISNLGDIYFISSNFEFVIFTGITIKYNRKTIIDCEFLVDKNIIYFFDIIFYNGNDLRGNKTYSLFKRLELMKEVRTNILENCKTFYIFDLKTYYYKDISANIFNFMDKYSKFIDGFIFIPILEPYPKTTKWPSLLKWKPPEYQTIDFQIKFLNNSWKPFVKDKDRLKQFSPNNREIDVINTNPIPLYEDDIVECYYKDESFYVHRKRYDKKYPNSINTANNNWKTIINPVLLSRLGGFSDYIIPEPYKPKRSESYFINMRRFHNDIKRKLISDNCLPTSLIDLACGKGADLNKWVSHEINHVIGIDINKKNILIAKTRLENIKKIKKLEDTSSYEFYEYDLRYYGLFEFLKKQNRYNVIPSDNITCNFAIHYFFQTENIFHKFLENVKRNLNLKGKFIITLFDGQKIYDLLKNENEISRSDDGEVMFSIKKMYTDIDTKPFFGQQIEVYLGGDTILSNDVSKEYVINIEEFIELMEEHEFKLLYRKSFESIYTELNQSNSYSMNEIEKEFSFLNTTLIFEYNYTERIEPIFKSEVEDLFNLEKDFARKLNLDQIKKENEQARQEIKDFLKLNPKISRLYDQKANEYNSIGGSSNSIESNEEGSSNSQLQNNEDIIADKESDISSIVSPNFSKMKLTELRELARKNNIKILTKDRKIDIITKLEKFYNK